VSIGNDEDEVRTDEIGPKLTGFWGVVVPLTTK
jgi:hypothetical protein